MYPRIVTYQANKVGFRAQQEPQPPQKPEINQEPEDFNEENCGCAEGYLDYLDTEVDENEELD